VYHVPLTDVRLLRRARSYLYAIVWEDWWSNRCDTFSQASEVNRLDVLALIQALLTANHNNRVYGSIRQNTTAITFFGTPHRGGNGATLGEIVANIASFCAGSGRNDLVKSLRKDSKFLVQLNADFKHLYEDFEYLSIVETKGPFKLPVRMVRLLVLFRAHTD
jgi:hypothetical protein